MIEVAVVFAVVIATCYALYYWSSLRGSAAIAEITISDQLCRNSDCHEILESAYGYLTAEYNMSRPQLEYCVGLDGLGSVRDSSSGGRYQATRGLRRAMVRVMSQPCGDLAYITNDQLHRAMLLAGIQVCEPEPDPRMEGVRQAIEFIDDKLKRDAPHFLVTRPENASTGHRC